MTFLKLLIQPIIIVYLDYW